MIDGQTIRRGRRELGLSLLILAGLGRVDHSLLWRWESGVYSAPPAFQDKVRRALDAVRIMLRDLPYQPNLRDLSTMRDLLARFQRGEFAAWRRTKRDGEMGTGDGKTARASDS